MNFCERKLFGILAAFLGIMLIQVAFLPAAADAEEEETVGWSLIIRLDFPGLGIQDTCRLWGPVDIRWLPPYPSTDFPPHFEIDSEHDSLRLRDREADRARSRFGFPIVGKAYVLDPEPWVESFFDVYFELEIPEHAPMDTLVNQAPIRILGLVHSWPPYYDTFKTPEGMPPVPLYGKDGLVVALVTSMEMEMVVHYPPEVHLSVSTAYRSEVAIVDEEGLVRMSAGLSGDYEATEAVFSYRESGDPGPFVPFFTDVDGSARIYSTINPEGSGDGWSAFFDPGSDPFEEHVYEYEAALLVPPFGFFRDTVIVWVDGTPSIPEFHDIARDSIAHFDIDSFFDITFQVDDEMVSPGPSRLEVFPLQLDFARELTPIDQLGLGTDLDSMSCGPTAAASCLKYFAENGYPTLDNQGGDPAKPEQSGEDIARELQGAMGTNSNQGTSSGGMVAGIGSYLNGHGQSGWSVEWHPVDDATDLAEMFREFQSDSEDVMVLLEDTTATGDTTGHWVTLGSTHTTYYQMFNPPFSVVVPEVRIDFMDPWGGGSQADNDYPLNPSGGGQPSTDGYDLNGEGGDAKVAGYVKVSPPEEMGAPAPGPMLAAAARAPWIVVDTGTFTGNGVVDTLHWDTSSFAGGLYLMEVVTIDDMGFECRDIRLAGIPTHTVDSDLPGLGMKTMLRGSYPNPFNPTTTIEYSLARDAKVTLAIYDVAGRRVRTLISGKMTVAGVHTVSWDGTNDAGRRLASGVYFANFLAEGQVSARKLILLR
jgi:hypothetical protein